MSSVQESLNGVNPQSNLQSDIKEFVCSLPHWGQVIAAVILSGLEINNSDIDQAYQVLLEDLNILPKTNRKKIDIGFVNNGGIHFQDIKFKELCNTEGINALAENQVLKFSNGLTIIYGINGAGKSGYIRLLKNVFYSKSREDILPNIHLDKDHKEPAAVFLFETKDGMLELKFPADITNPVFSQFSVFDGKAVCLTLIKKRAGIQACGAFFFLTVY